MIRSWRAVIPAAAVALMWFYEGFWCKVFPGRADQRAIVAGVPLLPAGALALTVRPAFHGVVPRRFDEVLRRRIERAVGRHPNAANPWAWRLLAGRELPGTPSAPGTGGRPVRLVLGDVVEQLAGAAPASFDAVTLSNVLDGPGPEFARRLRAAVRHAVVRPGGVVVLRSIREPGVTGPGLAARDRSMLWGVVRVVRVGAPGTRGAGSDMSADTRSERDS